MAANTKKNVERNSARYDRKAAEVMECFNLVLKGGILILNCGRNKIVF